MRTINIYHFDELPTEGAKEEAMKWWFVRNIKNDPELPEDEKKLRCNKKYVANKIRREFPPNEFFANGKIFRW